MPSNHQDLLQLLSSQDRSLSVMYINMSKELAVILKRYKITNNSRLWHRNKQVKKEVEELLKKYRKILFNHISTKSTEAWNLSNSHNDRFVSNYIKGITIPNPSLYYGRNIEALQSFLKRSANGLNLSDRVWNLTNQAQSQLEYFIAEGLTQGRSATKLAGDINRYLKAPEKRFRRIRNPETGKLMLSDPAKNYTPGTGVYRSSYKNALRLTRNEINIAYRTADVERRKQLPFVVGITVHLSPAHPQYDICDELVGDYPKNFNFVGWHPNCYSDDTEVLTDSGWKLFNELNLDDKIFSLNPITKSPEYVGFNAFIKRKYKGEMIYYKNRSLDLLVTPDHPIKYINKSNNSTFEECEASSYQSTKGGLYRSSEYSGKEINFITIGKHKIKFDLFSEFMGYYLSEGSISWTRKNQFHIAQSSNKHPKQHKRIKDLLKKLPIKFSEVETGFYLRDADFYNYLKQFGKSPDKHVPKIILNSSKSQISIFLEAYVICDGHVRRNKSFIGNRGNEFIPKNLERQFYTSSKKMSADIGEMLVKIGKRPSYKVQKSKGKIFRHKNGDYKSNHDIIRISECNSKTATVFSKTKENYDGYVYDVQLEKNHILYIRRNGKCVWGSNCLCFTTSKLLSKEDFVKQLNGQKMAKSKYTNTIPNRASGYLNKNAERIKGLNNMPYFIKDNFKNTKDGFDLKKAIGKKTV